MSRARRASLIVAALASLCFLVRELRLSAVAEYRGSQRYEDIYYLPPASWLPVLSLGFQAALADLIWCRSLVYFGQELLQRGGSKYAFEYTDAVIELDPNFRAAYEWIATAALYKPTDISLEDGKRAATYLKRALQRWPDDGQLHWRYGSVLRFELAPLMPPGAEKEHIIALALPHLATAASLGAGPPWLALGDPALLRRLGRTEQAIRRLEEIYATAPDDASRAKIEHDLAQLRSQSFVEALKTASAEFEQSRRDSYPYLAPDLFLLVGDKVAKQWPTQVAQRFLPPGELLESSDADAAGP